MTSERRDFIIQTTLDRLKAQGDFSSDERRSWLRNPVNGCKCIAGLWIIDEYYDPKMELLTKNGDAFYMKEITLALEKSGLNFSDSEEAALIDQMIQFHDDFAEKNIDFNGLIYRISCLKTKPVNLI